MMKIGQFQWTYAVNDPNAVDTVDNNRSVIAHPNDGIY
jgi:hypothetical protein